MTACSATNRVGDPCRMPPQRDARWCFTHHPANTGRLADVARSGGRASGVTRRRVARNRRLRRDEAISLFNHGPRCICTLCTMIRLAGLDPGRSNIARPLPVALGWGRDDGDALTPANQPRTNPRDAVG